MNRQSDADAPDNDVMRFGDIVKEKRLALKLSQATLAQRAGIEQPSLSDIESGETKKPSGPTLMNLCRVLKLDPNAALAGTRVDLDAPAAKAAVVNALRAQVAQVVAAAKILQIPLYRNPVEAGRGELLEEDDPDSTLDVPASWFRSIRFRGPLVATRVAGDSMYPTLQDGMRIVVDTGDNDQIISGGVYCFMTERGPLVKRLYVENGMVKAISDNATKHPAYFLTGEPKLIGKVVFRLGGL